MDINRVQTPGEPSLHLCHYPNCGKVYKKTSHLRAHLRWHIGDQPYPCSWPGCSKRFTRSDELHRHFRIHTGERRHKCSVCDKSFSRSDHLKKHMMSHHSQESDRILSHRSDGELEIDPTQLLEVEDYGSMDGEDT
ncbi:transcription factor Sp8 [Eurytemora carolleeae]|uniref:transcription factor Sp8 n=1 Tax=Eurytemora carolleeae TaxID=1294199 RepID=UPI000C76851A|nr:transcription factor Sp8 [Eurytemora carolleeae]|eukprot:XP_023324938.1 transcription factor Sp8-like [Eurytemora affinis]